MWIYPSQDFDNHTGAMLVSYTSPAFYNFTKGDRGKTIFFVNSVGIRCQLGVSLLANVVAGNVLMGRQQNFVNNNMIVAAINKNDTLSDVNNESKHNATGSDNDDTANGESNERTDSGIDFDEDCGDTSVAIGIQSTETNSKPDESSVGSSIGCTSLMVAGTLLTAAQFLSSCCP